MLLASGAGHSLGTDSRSCLLTATSTSATDAQKPYADLIARSKALTPAQKNQAQQIFNTGFTLWQSGDFQTALKAFKRGLDIDPANPQANYYYGDCLRQTKQRKDAVEFLTRAKEFGGSTTEGFKAETALEELAKPPTVDEMSSEELKDLYVGTWKEGNAEFKISKDAKGELIISGSLYVFLAGTYYFRDLKFDGKEITYTFRLDEKIFWQKTLHIVSPDRMEGTSVCSWAGTAPTFAIRVK